MAQMVGAKNIMDGLEIMMVSLLQSGNRGVPLKKIKKKLEKLLQLKKLPWLRPRPSRKQPKKRLLLLLLL